MYPKLPDYAGLAERIKLYAQLKHEYGATGVGEILGRTEKVLKGAVKELKALRGDKLLSMKRPNDLAGIQALRSGGPRRLWEGLDKKVYRDKVEGALLGRMAGCILGSPVEFWSIEKMKALAAENGDSYPPLDYWRYVPEPAQLRYGMSPLESFTREKMRGVPVDDDIIYTLLGLLVLEEYGADFSVEENGRAWLKYLPCACTAEEVALNNLKAGVSALKAGEKNNPYCEWIGAWIRSDPWGYAAAGWPERAASMAYRDAYLTHRREGIYGEMFFAATIAAAFAVDDPLEAVAIGLTEVPKSCALAGAIRWALKQSSEVKDYQQARDLMEKRFAGMNGVHTINNACLVVWGLAIGGTDLTKVISETVAMGMDNDCTAATAGSIVGAIVGKSGVDEHWYRPFDNTVHSYLIGKRRFSISGLVNRFTKQAFLVWSVR